MINKFLRIITLSGLLLTAASCDKDETSSSSPSKNDYSDVKYTVIDETDVSLNTLFNNSINALQWIPDSRKLNDEIAQLREAYELSAEKLGDTESTVLGFKLVTVTYLTKDESDKDVKVSALIVYPLSTDMDKVMLINHGTHIGPLMVPTNYTAVETILAATGALCILPDYIGIGASVDHKDLYLNAKVHGTTSTDALRVLLAYARQKRLSLSKDFSTYIVGYSQGGSVSLATLREIQSRPKDKQDEIHLKKVICGDGPYDLKCTFDTYLKEDQEDLPMGLPAVIPNVINSMINSYPSEMGQYDYEDFFTEWALSTGVPQAIRDNSVTAFEMVVPFLGRQMKEILNMQYLQENPKAAEDLFSMMDRQNLCNDWSPEYPLHFFHCNPDGVVPYKNFENAYSGLKNEYVDTPETPDAQFLYFSPLLQHCYGMVSMMLNVLSGQYF